jgi:Raf kinase inhibitor-like YbhB/YbcL family protein
MKRTIICALLNLIVLSTLLADNKFAANSSTFKSGGQIPTKCAFFGAKGKNISPEISWKNAPQETKSFVLSCIDINPIAKRWVHWMILNIPADISSIAEGAGTPKGAIALRNSYRKPGYGGPQPPRGSGVHKYVFTIYALNVPKLDLKKRFMSEAALLKELKGKIIAKTSFYGTYQR